jgi:DNA polymerase-3 subunit chi
MALQRHSLLTRAKQKKAMQIWFYHLGDARLERVLPSLIERALDRGWKCVVQATSAELLSEIDDLLWTYSDASFIAHATAKDGDAEWQAVYLTQDIDNPNQASVRFFVEGASIAAALNMPQAASYERCLLLFNGSDQEQLENARRQWAELKAAGCDLAYFQQDGDGRWRQKAGAQQD